MSAAMTQIEEAFTKKRKEMYGDAWQAFDFWGVPDRELPEEHRQDLLRWMRRILKYEYEDHVRRVTCSRRI